MNIASGQKWATEEELNSVWPCITTLTTTSGLWKICWLIVVQINSLSKKRISLMSSMQKGENKKNFFLIWLRQTE